MLQLRAPRSRGCAPIGSARQVGLAWAEMPLPWPSQRSRGDQRASYPSQGLALPVRVSRLVVGAGLTGPREVRWAEGRQAFSWQVTWALAEMDSLLGSLVRAVLWLSQGLVMHSVLLALYAG